MGNQEKASSELAKAWAAYERARANKEALAARWVEAEEALEEAREALEEALAMWEKAEAENGSI